LIPVESVTVNQFAAQLDQIAGIDAWVIQRGTYMYGLASRVQWIKTEQGKRPYNTFSVRMSRPNGVPTEYQKRKAQIATSGALYPKWTCQAYLADSDSSFLTAGVAMTEHVIEAVDRGIGRMQPAPKGVLFWAVPWKGMQAAGCPSVRYTLSRGVWLPTQETL
jgi:hypothetical protein